MYKNRNKNTLLIWVPKLFSVVVLLCIAGAAVMVMQGFMSQPTPSKKMVQQFTLLPPPPKVEEPPPPPEIEEKLETIQEEPIPDPIAESSDEPPAGEDLGLDAEGTADGDGFGLVGKKNGRDLLSADGSYKWFANTLKSDLQDHLSGHSDIRRKRYAVEVRMWIEPNGKIQRIKLLKSTGDKQTDSALQLVLADYHQSREKPPQDMPSPVTLRIISRL